MIQIVGRHYKFLFKRCRVLNTMNVRAFSWNSCFRISFWLVFKSQPSFFFAALKCHRFRILRNTYNTMLYFFISLDIYYFCVTKLILLNNVMRQACKIEACEGPCIFSVLQRIYWKHKAISTYAFRCRYRICSLSQVDTYNIKSDVKIMF